MEVKTYRAASMQEALALVRRELGPDAAVLQTREVNGSALLRWIPGMRKIEVTASSEVNVPSRLPPRSDDSLAATTAWRPARDMKSTSQDEMSGQLLELHSMVEDLCRRSRSVQGPDLPETLFRLYTDLIEAEMSEDLAREMVDRVRTGVGAADLNNLPLLQQRLLRMLEDEITVAGPLGLCEGECHLVALVGPTGVGKTTTIAKLAANYRLREKKRVGLITVDTYRIAAVEQLRTYADIIDLPMEVVSTPREMREAVGRMADLDLVLLDTAGRSPKDEVKLQELKCFLAEAGANEVHLVMSSVASAHTLQRTAEQFAMVGTTSLILTKLDEASSLGHILPALRSSQLPLSYVTDGQNVPDDIAPADRRRLACSMLGMEKN